MGGGFAAKFRVSSPLRSEIAHRKPDIIFLQDTRLPSPPRPKPLPNYIALYAPPWRPESTQRVGDKLIYIRTNLLSKCLYRNPTPYISILDFPQSKFALLAIYFPPATTNYRAIILQAHQQLGTLCQLHTAQTYKFILCGDLNATPIEYPRRTGRKWADTSLHRFILQYHLTLHRIISTRDPPYTWNNSQTSSFIDLAYFSDAPIWTIHKPTLHILDTWLQSDHTPIWLTIPKAFDTTYRSDILFPPFRITTHPKCYPRAIKQFVNLIPTLHSILDDFQSVFKSKQTLVDRVGGLLEFVVFLIGWDSGAIVAAVSHNPRTITESVNNNIRSLAAEISRLKHALLSLPSNSDRKPHLIAQISSTQGELEFAILADTFHRLNKLNLAAESAYNQRQLRQMWRRITTKPRHIPQFANSDGTVDPSYRHQAKLIRSYFQTLFNRQSPPLIPYDQTRMRELLAKPPNPIINRPFSKKEVLKALKRKKNVSPGIDGMPSALWLALHRSSPDLLTRAFNIYLEHGRYPLLTSHEMLTAIPKPGKPMTLPNLRGISTLTISHSLLVSCYTTRIAKGNLSSLHPVVGGFVPHRSYQDNVFLLKAIIATARYHKRNIGLQLFDVSKCFDSLTQAACSYGILESVGPGKIYELCKNIYAHRKVCVKWNTLYHPPFLATRGRPQGATDSVEYPKLFTNALPFAFRAQFLGISLLGVLWTCLIYADDVLTIFPTVSIARKQKALVKRQFNRFGLSLNAKKHEYFFIGAPAWVAASRRRLQTIDPDANFPPHNLRYLGYILSAHDPDTREHTKRVIRRGKAQFFSLCEQGLLIGSPNPFTMIHIWRNVISPSILYMANLQTWTRDELRQIESLQLRSLAASLHIGRKVNRALVYTIVGVKPAYFFIESQQMLYFLSLLSPEFESRAILRQTLLHQIDMVKYGSPSIGTRPPGNRILHATLTGQTLRIAARYGYYPEWVEFLRTPSRYSATDLKALRKYIVHRPLLNIRNVYLNAVRKSNVPIAPYICAAYAQKWKAWEAFSITHPTLNDYLSNINEEASPSNRQRYFSRARVPYFPELVSALLPPYYPKKANAHLILRVYFSLLIDCPSWHHCSHVTPGTCYYCKRFYTHAGFHLLYECPNTLSYHKNIPTHSTFLNYTTSRVSLTYVPKRADILPFYTPEEIWLLSASLAQTPEPWTLKPTKLTNEQLNDITDQIREGFDLATDI